MKMCAKRPKLRSIDEFKGEGPICRECAMRLNAKWPPMPSKGSKLAFCKGCGYHQWTFALDDFTWPATHSSDDQMEFLK
jgi:hypothetical protein